MSEAKPESMAVSDALEIVRDSMGLWCAEYDEETGEQCQSVPVWTLKNLKHDTSSHRCEEHKPEKAHFADFVDPFRGAVAFDMIVTAITTAERERDEARAELAQERADLAALTARVEAEIPAACAAVRERTIAECVAFAVATEAGLAMRGEFGKMHVGAHDVVLAHRALATPQPVPVDSLDVDPAAGALR